MRLQTGGLTCLVALFSLLEVATAVKHADFKTCAQSSFCRRGRAFADQVSAAGPAWIPQYEVDSGTVTLSDGVLTATIWKTVSEPDGGRVKLPLTISFLDNSVARVQLDEARRRKGDIELRNGSKVKKQRYNEAEKWALVGGKNFDAHAKILNSDKGSMKVQYGPGELQALIEYKPFKITFMRYGETQVVLNERNLLNVEHWRPQKEKKEGEEPGEDESTWWDETFGGNTDSKPRGWYYSLEFLVRIFIDYFQDPKLLVSISLSPVMNLYMVSPSMHLVFP